MLFAISGILARIPVKGKVAHALHCSYRVSIFKAPSQILLTPPSRGTFLRFERSEAKMCPPGLAGYGATL